MPRSAALQAKLSNELGGRTPIIRRADLGAQGRLLSHHGWAVRSAQEAEQFCASLKAAGGQCIVQTN